MTTSDALPKLHRTPEQIAVCYSAEFYLGEQMFMLGLDADEAASFRKWIFNNRPDWPSRGAMLWPVTQLIFRSLIAQPLNGVPDTAEGFQLVYSLVALLTHEELIASCMQVLNVSERKVRELLVGLAEEIAALPNKPLVTNC